jgi:cytochrome c-type biogenesis protein
MIEVGIGFAVSVFIAGVLMFLAPCTLPLVPAYLAFISGVRSDELKNPETRIHARKAILINGIAFVLGFSTVFVGFGFLAGFFGAFIGQFRNILSQIGGGFIILFGLMMLNVVKFEPLIRERKMKVPAFLTPGHPTSAFGIGATFALGWTPCVGPVLASVLLLATTQTTALQGGLLLGIFSLGLAVPFLLTALAYAQASAFIPRISNFTTWISYVGGVFLIFLGALLLTGNFGFTVEYGYKIFNFIGIDGLFDYL